MKSQGQRCVEGHYAMHTPRLKEKGERRKTRGRRKKKEDKKKEEKKKEEKRS